MWFARENERSEHTFMAIEAKCEIEFEEDKF